MPSTSEKGRDRAAFYLNLSRTGGDVVAYRLAGRPAFLVNTPAHAARVLEERESNYTSPAHPYGELAGLYTPEGASLMRLERARVEGGAAHERAARTLAEAGARAAVTFRELSEGGPFNVEFETKKLMFAVVARLLFGVDASHLAGEFVSAVAFAEECWAGGLYQTPSAEPDAAERRYFDSLARQDAVAGGEVARQRYFEDRVSPYQRMVQLLVARKRAGEALACAERAKARVLLEVLCDGRAQFGRAVTAPEREREQRLQQGISTLNSQISEESLRPKGGPAHLGELKARLQKARLDYDAFRADLYAAHPELRIRRGEVRPFTLADAEGLVPDARTALLEYVVGEEKTHVFVLTKRDGRADAPPIDLAVYELNIGRKDLDARAADFRQQLASRALEGLYKPARSAVYTGAAAREDRLKAEAGSARVLHLATHGVLDDAQPLASHVLLSKGDAAGGEDGMLEARELMQMELRADLVVLSACETARGRVGAGEGVLGLTWALFVAGSPTTVVSQWKVEESSTTELMVEFHRLYREKLKAARPGVSTAGALRSAALALSRKERYAHPFYWAGFVVVGDGR